jgi:hypothetical protein
MTEMYAQEEIGAARLKKKRMWTAFWCTASAVLLADAAIFVLAALEFGNRNLMCFFNILLTALYACGMYFFFSIKFKLTRRFNAMLKGFDTGLSEERYGVFVSFDDTEAQKDGVYCYTMLTTEHYDKRGIPSERRIMIERTRPHPEIDEGDTVHYFTHANFLMRYGVTRKADGTSTAARAADKTDGTGKSGGASVADKTDGTESADIKGSVSE